MNEAAKREAKKRVKKKRTHPKQTEGQTATWGDNKSTTNNAKFELGLVWASSSGPGSDRVRVRAATPTQPPLDLGLGLLISIFGAPVRRGRCVNNGNNRT